MKKLFKSYAILWVIAIAVFNAVVFIAPNETGKYVKFGGAFWSGYALITAAFIGQLIVSIIFFKEDNKEKTFLNLSMFSWSISCLVTSLIVGAALMIIPNVPQWAGAIAALIILCFYAFAVILAKGAAEVVNDVGERVKVNTAFIKGLTVAAETLVAKAKSDSAKKAAEKVYEAVRFSNKSSHGGLDDVENRILTDFASFEDAIAAGDDAKVTAIGDRLTDLLSERDSLAKVVK